MEPLNWTLCDPDELEALEGDLANLVTHLEQWSAPTQRFGPVGIGPSDPRDRARRDRGLYEAPARRRRGCFCAQRLIQSFMTGTDLLQLDLNVEGKSSSLGFSSGSGSRRASRHCGLSSTTQPICTRFSRRSPGPSTEPKKRYWSNLFFANEAIVADEGSFTIYPDFPALPEPYAEALRGNLGNLRTELEKQRKEAEQESSNGEPKHKLLERTLAHVDAALAGHEALGFNSVEYDRNEDHYFFVIFMTYSNGLFSAKIAVNRATGAPTMTDDQPLAEIPEPTRPPRLPQLVVSPALTPRIGPVADGAARPDCAPFRPRRLPIFAHGSALEDTTVEGDLALPRSASLTSLRIRNSGINGSLILTGLPVSGEVQIENLRVSGGIDLRNARVGGSMRADRRSGGSVRQGRRLGRERRRAPRRLGHRRSARAGRLRDRRATHPVRRAGRRGGPAVMDSGRRPFMAAASPSSGGPSSSLPRTRAGPRPVKRRGRPPSG